MMYNPDILVTEESVLISEVRSGGTSGGVDMEVLSWRCCHGGVVMEVLSWRCCHGGHTELY